MALGVAALGACGPADGALIIDLVTDHRPGSEFDLVEVELDRGGIERQTVVPSFRRAAGGVLRRP